MYLFILLGLFLGLVVITLWAKVPHIQADLETRARYDVHRRNFGFARIVVDGRDLYISGVVPHEAERRAAVDPLVGSAGRALRGAWARWNEACCT